MGGGATQPQARIILHIGFCNRNLGALAHIYDCWQGCDEVRSYLVQALWQILALIVRIETVFLWVVDDEIVGKPKVRFLAIDFYLFLRHRCLESISHTFVVCAEDDRIAPVQGNMQLVVVLANPGKLLPDHRLNHLVIRSLV